MFHPSNQAPMSPPPPHTNPPVVATETANYIQQTDPVMATLMLRMMANMEAMRFRVEGNEIHYKGYRRGRGQRRGRGRSRERE